MIRFLATFLCLFLCCACVTRQTYYLPRIMEEQWEASNCGYRQGGYIADLSESDGVFVEMIPSDSGLWISLQFSLPPYASVRFLSDLAVVSYIGGSQLEGTLIAVHPKSLVGQPIVESLIADEPPLRVEGPDGIDGLVSVHIYDYTATVEGEFPDEVVLIIPPFFVNDVEYKLGPIDMLRVEKLSLLTC